jgi:hypothetical protein
MAGSAAYRLEGKEIEACDCASLCPCVFGDEPEHNGCVGILARHITTGEIRGIDVSGLTWLEVFQSPGHQLETKTRKLVYLDRDATLDQLSALRDAFEGRLGGPLAELAKLTAQWLDVVQADIECDVEKGNGRVAVTGKLRVVMSPRRSRDGTPTTLRDAFFNTVPDSPAWVAKASELTVVVPEHGLQFAFEGRSAIESDFRYVG